MGERKKMLTAEEIEAAALQLPDEEFAQLVERLRAHQSADPEFERYWIEEAERRIAAIQASGEEGIDFEEITRQPLSMELRAAAISLPPSEREALADELLASVSDPDTDVDPTWMREALRRLEDVYSGRVQAVDAEDFLKRFDVDD